jgi:prepilin signal peptidase PulO-like enzyme (type II secretory pathway)
MALIVLKKREWSDKIPFGVYLTAGTYVAIGWGDELIHWYLRGVMGL